MFLGAVETGLVEARISTLGLGRARDELYEAGLPRELVEQLRSRMQQDPDNAEGWFLLGRTYMRLQNYTQAVNAFENVVRLLPDETAGLLSLADAMTMQNDRRVGAAAWA